MKALIVYDENGNTVFSQSNVNGKYYMRIQEMGEEKVVIGIDLETNSIITVDTFLSLSERTKRVAELTKRNQDYLLTHKLGNLERENLELNSEIKEEIKRLKGANAEIIEYVNMITGTKVE